MCDEVNGFIKRVKLWERRCEDGAVSCFLLLDAHLTTTDVDRSLVVKMVDADFNQYFHDIEAKSENIEL
ncbi:zinc finger BED domain-containing protein 5-like, partial [Scomber scombrus]